MCDFAARLHGKHCGPTEGQDFHEGLMLKFGTMAAPSVPKGSCFDWLVEGLMDLRIRNLPKLAKE